MTETELGGLNTYPDRLLSTEQRPAYEEWQRLYDICNTPPPEGTQINTVIMPTGDLLDRAGPAAAVFLDLAKTQEVPPFLVVSGKWSDPRLDGGGASAVRVIQHLKDSGIVPVHLWDYLVPENESGNTKEQGVNLYQMIKAGWIKGPHLVACSPYHIPRFMSTFIEQISKHQDPVTEQVYSAPIEFLSWEEKPAYDWNDVRGENERWMLVLSEVTRIHNYRKGGDVASEEKMLEYSKWLRSQ